MQGDDVCSTELLFADEVTPVLRLDVETLDGVVGEDVAGVHEGDNMGVVGEDLKGDWIHHIPVIVLREMELDEIDLFEWNTRYGVCAMLFQPWQDVDEVEYCSLGTADRVIEGLERYGAEVEGQAFEWRRRGG